MSPIGAIFVPSPPKTWTNLLHPRPSQSLNGSSSKFGLDWPQIDRLAKIQGQVLLIVKLWTRVAARGTTYVCGVGTDDREERWETIGAQLEALDEIVALTR